MEYCNGGDLADYLNAKGTLKGVKVNNEINRDKLNLLIEFLKKDGGPVQSYTYTEKSCPPSLPIPRTQNDRIQNRRKLSKTCIVRNKNTEREMISLVSHKTTKYSSKTFPAMSSFSGTAEMGNGTSKRRRSDENDASSADGRQQTKNMERNEERTQNWSCVGEDVTMEERNIINIMRAFQKLKNHFCASCAFISPAESIWINVVSGELRCLNCFKKMILKAEENVRNSKNWVADDVSASNAEGIDKDEAGVGGRENTQEKTFEKKSEDFQEQREEEIGVEFQNTSGNLKKERVISTNKITGKEQCGTKRRASDEQVRPAVKFKGEKSLRTNSSEKHASEKYKKKESEQAMESRDRSTKRSNSTEKFVPHKVQIIEKQAEESKHKSDGCARKSHPKEYKDIEKTEIPEEMAKKSKKHDSWDTLKVVHRIKRSTEDRSHKVEEAKVKDGKMEHISEKTKRKRMTGDEKLDLKKKGTVEECNKGKLEKLPSSEKLKTHKESKEGGDRTKIAAEGKNQVKAKDYKWDIRSNESKEVSRKRKSFEEELNKVAELFFLLSKRKKQNTKNQTEPPKVKTSLPICMPPKITSKEEKQNTTKTKNEEFDSRKSCSSKPAKKESEHEEKKEYYSEKIPKISDTKKNSENNNQKKLDDKHCGRSKQCLISRLFKGKKTTKINPNAKFGEVHQVQVHRIENNMRQAERDCDSNSEGNHQQSQTYKKTPDRPVENRGSMKLHSGKEPTNVKKPHQTHEVSPREKEGKAVTSAFDKIIKDRESPLGAETKGKAMTHSTALMERLRKTTKKLSWKLLGTP